MKEKLEAPLWGGHFPPDRLPAFRLLLVRFAQVRFGAGNTYDAEFNKRDQLRKGKLVGIAGVEVGTVKNIAINRDRTVRVE